MEQHIVTLLQEQGPLTNQDIRKMLHQKGLVFTKTELNKTLHASAQLAYEQNGINKVWSVRKDHHEQPKVEINMDDIMPLSSVFVYPPRKTPSWDIEARDIPGQFPAGRNMTDNLICINSYEEELFQQQ